MTLTQASEGGLKISNAGTNGQFLQKQSGDTGGLTWATVSSGTNVGGSNGVDFNDDVYIRLGTGNDLKIWHNAGANSYIRNESGNLLIESNGAGADAIQVVAGGAVELFHNGTKKLNTDSWGVAITGELTATNHINIPNDTGKFMVGASNDLQIYHDNSTGDSIISHQGATGGDLIIQTTGSDDDVWIKCNDDFIVNVEGGAENAIIARNSGAVELYEDGTKRLETTSSGVAITGNGTFDAAGQNYVRIGSTDAGGAILTLDGDSDGDGSGADYCMIMHDTDGHLKIYADNPADAANIQFYSNSSTERMRISSDGKVLIGTTTAPTNTGADNLVIGDSGNAGITLRSGSDYSGLIYFSDATSGTGEYAGFIQYSHGSTNVMYLGAGSATRMEIRSTGNVKISNGSLLMGTAGTGINFSATADGTGASNVAEILDDYEEGTFTPTIRANANTNGSADGTASYVKVGKKVHINVNIGNKTLTGFPGSGPGTIRIDGLPFPANQQNADEMSVSSKCIIMGVDNNSNNIYFITQNSQSYLLGYYNADGSVWVASDAGFWDNSGVYCIFTMTYFTNS